MDVNININSISKLSIMYRVLLVFCFVLVILQYSTTIHEYPLGRRQSQTQLRHDGVIYRKTKIEVKINNNKSSFSPNSLDLLLKYFL